MTTAETTRLAVLASEAGRLVRAGLNPKHRPSRDADYQALVLRYDHDREFQAVVRAFAGAQGLSIVACDRIEGIVFAPTDDSPFRVRGQDYIQLPGADVRLMHGLVHLAIAATAYPNAAALEDGSRLVSVSALQVFERLNRFVDDARRGAFNLDAPPEDAPELEPVWQMLARKRKADSTPDQRETPHTIVGAIRKAFRWLEDHGLATEVADDTWRLGERYRLGVLATATDAIDVVRQHLEASAAPSVDAAAVASDGADGGRAS